MPVVRRNAQTADHKKQDGHGNAAPDNERPAPRTVNEEPRADVSEKLDRIAGLSNTDSVLNPC